ncbi:hypothetical protein SFC76_03190 [Sphingomonas sp. CD22]|uniref:hypothetical protein n=1 Tax=Sphingomonas sp. CD22 TaxID=3100214 RepID=UPI002ADF7D31|nr:hypothetical protein [Sphingomonas sp. CD22]MEA1083253.1 hypothetical protein [Sphingomonas sp. CD22]
MKVMYCALLSALFVCAPATAQTAMPIIAGAQDAAVLRAGTSVPLKMAEALTTNGKKLKVGQRFQLQTAEPIALNGMTVIPAGSPVTGEVTEVRNKGMWGKSGRINARVLFVRANGRQIRMSGQLDDKGTTGTVGVVGAIAVIPVAGFFVTGTSANIPLGAPATGFIDEDVPVAFAGGAPAAMVVAPAAPAAVVAPIKVAPAASVPATK